MLREAKRLPDGRFDVVTTASAGSGCSTSTASAAPYLIGSVEWLGRRGRRRPRPADKAELPVRWSARAAHRRYCEAAWQQRRLARAAGPASRLAELAYVLAADCLLTFEDRQKLLEDNSPLHRLRTVGRLLSREAGIMAALHAVPAPPPQHRTPFSQN